MLCVDDIKERLTRNPEPEEIKLIRENIINSFSKLQFIEEGHKYFVTKDDGSTEELPSVSHICHMFEQYVDWDDKCVKKAEKLGIEVSELKRQWRENNLRSTNNGTKTHAFGENLMYFCQGDFDKIQECVKNQFEGGFFIPYGKKEEAVMKFYEDIMKVDNVYPVMAEAKIYTGINDTLNLKQNYSGTFDMLFAYKMKDGYKLAIYDFKTNASLVNQFNIQHDVRMLTPFEDMIDQSLSKYTIQLSAYQLGIQQLGYEIVDRKIIWLKDDGTYEKISVRDVTKELVDVLS
ncbi:MAG: hypothetical protein IKT40_08960 [Bacilli bacterium]|nr:hypothetical protein [Bacilli bacterium]